MLNGAHCVVKGLDLYPAASAPATTTCGDNGVFLLMIGKKETPPLDARLPAENGGRYDHRNEQVRDNFPQRIGDGQLLDESSGSTHIQCFYTVQ